ncbi:hypothetical protein HDU96_000286, partial [Phlyctochytrium bullatum]
GRGGGAPGRPGPRVIPGPTPSSSSSIHAPNPSPTTAFPSTPASSVPRPAIAPRGSSRMLMLGGYDKGSDLVMEALRREQQQLAAGGGVVVGAPPGAFAFPVAAEQTSVEAEHVTAVDDVAPETDPGTDAAPPTLERPPKTPTTPDPLEAGGIPSMFGGGATSIPKSPVSTLSRSRATSNAASFIMPASPVPSTVSSNAATLVHGGSLPRPASKTGSVSIPSPTLPRPRTASASAGSTLSRSLSPATAQLHDEGGGAYPRTGSLSVPVSPLGSPAARTGSFGEGANPFEEAAKVYASEYAALAQAAARALQAVQAQQQLKKKAGGEVAPAAAKVAEAETGDPRERQRIAWQRYQELMRSRAAPQAGRTPATVSPSSAVPPPASAGPLRAASSSFSGTPTPSHLFHGSPTTPTTPPVTTSPTATTAPTPITTRPAAVSNPPPPPPPAPPLLARSASGHLPLQPTATRPTVHLHNGATVFPAPVAGLAATAAARLRTLSEPVKPVTDDASRPRTLPRGLPLSPRSPSSESPKPPATTTHPVPTVWGPPRDDLAVRFATTPAPSLPTSPAAATALLHALTRERLATPAAATPCLDRVLPPHVRQRWEHQLGSPNATRDAWYALATTLVRDAAAAGAKWAARATGRTRAEADAHRAVVFGGLVLPTGTSEGPPACARCGPGTIETPRHVLLECPPARAMWTRVAGLVAGVAGVEACEPGLVDVVAGFPGVRGVLDVTEAEAEDVASREPDAVDAAKEVVPRGEAPRCPLPPVPHGTNPLSPLSPALARVSGLHAVALLSVLEARQHPQAPVDVAWWLFRSRYAARAGVEAAEEEEEEVVGEKEEGEEALERETWRVLMRFCGGGEGVNAGSGWFRTR